MQVPVTSTLALGRALKDARIQRDLTQKELSDLTGISQPALSSIERGRNRSLTTILRILAALELELVLRDRVRPDPADIWEAD